MYKTPYEIAQSQLRDLRFMMVEDTLPVSALYPLFDRVGAVKVFLVDQASAGKKNKEPFEPGLLKMVSEFPMEVRLPKAIYLHPIAQTVAAAHLSPELLQGLWYLDPWERILRHPELSEAARQVLQDRNLAFKSYRSERLEDVFFTRDLRKVIGALARQGLLSRHRLEWMELSKLFSS